MDLQGQWALVTGASSGIGVDIARELASRGMNLLLVARRQERLDQLAKELRHDHGVQAETDACDLQKDGAVAALFERTVARGHDIAVLVNNAGFGLYGNFVDHGIEQLQAMLRLNVSALTELTHVFARSMAERGGGHILQLTSIAGVNPLPSYAAYAATKAYILSLSGAIAHELGKSNVSVTALMPGLTRTEFFDISGQKPNIYSRLVVMSPSDVARIGVKAMLAKRHYAIAGWRNWFIIAMAAVFPRRVRAWMTWQLMKLKW